MIIKTTFNDNDFTNILEKYWDRFMFDNYYKAVEDIEDLRLYRDLRIDMEELLKKAIYNEADLTAKEESQFEDYIKQSILAFVKKRYPSNLDYLKDQLYVNTRLTVKDKDENGEVVYYFLKHQKYITM